MRPCSYMCLSPVHKTPSKMFSKQILRITHSVHIDRKATLKCSADTPSFRIKIMHTVSYSGQYDLLCGSKGGGGGAIQACATCEIGF